MSAINFTGKVNPYDESIAEWAYDRDAPWPHQDHDITVAGIIGWENLFHLCSDKDCPKRDFFLAVAYWIVGDAVLTKFESIDERYIGDMIERFSQSAEADLKLFVERARALLDSPASLVYEDWCDGKVPSEEKI